MITTSNLIFLSFPQSSFISPAVLPFQDQPEVVQSQRKAEVQSMQRDFRWGTGEGYTDLPGYTAATTHDDLPRNVQFTDVATRTFKAGKKAGLINLGLTT